MCWLIEQLTKEAVSYVRGDADGLGDLADKEWLAVFSSSSCSTLVVEQAGVRRAVSKMALVGTGITLLRRVVTAAAGRSWLADRVLRDVHDIITSSSVRLSHPQTLQPSLVTSPGSAFSRHVLSQRSCTSDRPVGGAGVHCGGGSISDRHSIVTGAGHAGGELKEPGWDGPACCSKGVASAGWTLSQSLSRWGSAGAAGAQSQCALAQGISTPTMGSLL